MSKKGNCLTVLMLIASIGIASAEYPDSVYAWIQQNEQSKALTLAPTNTNSKLMSEGYDLVVSYGGNIEYPVMIYENSALLNKFGVTLPANTATIQHKIVVIGGGKPAIQKYFTLPITSNTQATAYKGSIPLGEYNSSGIYQFQISDQYLNPTCAVSECVIQEQRALFNVTILADKQPEKQPTITLVKQAAQKPLPGFESVYPISGLLLISLLIRRKVIRKA